MVSSYAGMAFMADYADDEFDGRSYNGASLMATLMVLDAGAAAEDSSYEGYSAWSVALHVAECKHIVARSLLGDSGRLALGPYPYPTAKGGFVAPPDSSSSAWAGLLAYLETVHHSLAAAIRACGDEELGREMPEWKIPNAKAIAWVCGHDSYHTAQIRNMGLPAFREKRAY
jgi:hypothetical protein